MMSDAMGEASSEELDGMMALAEVAPAKLA